MPGGVHGGEHGGALSEDDVVVLSFTGACSPETENNHRMAGCAAECKIIRPGIGLEPLTIFREVRHLGELCTENMAAFMGLIVGVRQLLHLMPALNLPSAIGVILESDNKTVCEHIKNHTLKRHLVPAQLYEANALAFAMICHPRLGERSPAHNVFTMIPELMPGIWSQHFGCVEESSKVFNSVAQGLLQQLSNSRIAEQDLTVRNSGSEAQAGLTESIFSSMRTRSPPGSSVVFCPNLCTVSTAVFPGMPPVNCTNDVMAAGSSRKFLIDANFLVSVPGFSDALESLEDPGSVSMCSGNVTSTVLGILRQPLRMQIFWDGPRTMTPGNRGQDVEVGREVYVVQGLPVPLHVAYNNQIEVGFPGLMMGPGSVRVSADVFLEPYRTHPYWGSSLRGVQFALMNF
jgi:hypothetical protein